VPVVWVQRGLVLGELGDYAGAVRAFSTAARLDPKRPEPWAGKGLALLNLGRSGQAVKAWERAFRLASNAVTFSYAYSRALVSPRSLWGTSIELRQEVVSEQLLLRVQELSLRNHPPERLRAELLRWYRLFEGTPWEACFSACLAWVAGFLTGRRSKLSAPIARSWLEALAPPFPEKPPLALLRNLFEVTLKYSESGGEKILMELPLELRKLIAR